METPDVSDSPFIREAVVASLEAVRFQADENKKVIEGHEATLEIAKRHRSRLDQQIEHLTRWLEQHPPNTAA